MILSSKEGAYHYPTTREGLIELLDDIELSSLASDIGEVVCKKNSISKPLEFHIL